MPNTRSIKVLCVDDHRIVREGLSLIIGRQPDMEVVATASSGEEAIDLFSKCRPDVTLMDLNLRGLGGLDAIKAIRRQDPHARIIVLTMYNGEEYIHRAIEAGAASYLLKDTLSRSLIEVIREVHAGHRRLPEDVARRLAERPPQVALTPREIEVLALIAKGHSNKQVASALAISAETVHAHVRNVFMKLDVSDRTSAVMEAVRRGMISMR